MLEETGEAYLGRTAGASDPLHGIAAEIERTLKIAGAWPRPATLRQRGERFRNSDDDGVAAAAPCEGDDMAAVRPADLQWHMVAVSEQGGTFAPQFQELAG